MKKKIAVAQLTSGEDCQDNLAQAIHCVDQAITNGADLIAFPECFLFLGRDEHYLKVAQSLDGTFVSTFRREAREKNISILMGSFPEIDPADSKMVFNTSVLINSAGEIEAFYRKIHLFDVELPGLKLFESATVSRGQKIVTAIHEIGCLGLSICYDLRFPNLYQQLSSKGAKLIFVPAAFTFQTGKAHWITLLKARAIENQLFIVAPCQFGYHNSKRRSYGHSVIINPWGEILALAPDRITLIYAEIDLELVQKIRSEMPVFNHRVKGVDIL
jgi:predicted amidohydrolase